MGNPDLELQNPVRDPPCPRRRQRRDTAAGLCTAVAAGILLAIGVWSICVDATTRSLQKLQQQQKWSGHSAPRIVLAANRVAGATVVDEVEQCAIRNLNKATSFLQGIKGIAADEFLARRDTLARQLNDEGVDAFIIEPGFTFEYYANVSRVDWDEPYESQKSPLLMVIQPVEDDHGAVVAKTAFVAPRSAVDRVRTLPIPSSRRRPLDIVAWEPHWNPYATLRRSGLFPPADPEASERIDQRPVLAVDRYTRAFIVDGLSDAGFRHKRLAATPPSKQSPAEAAIARGLGLAAAAAVHAVRPCLVPGVTADDARRMLRAALASVGLAPHKAVVLFHDKAGGDRPGRSVLGDHDVVTVEVGVRHLGCPFNAVRRFSVDPAGRQDAGEVDGAGDGAKVGGQ